MKTYSHREKSDLLELRADMADMPLADKATVVFLSCRAGLFRVSASLRIALSLVGARHGQENGARRFGRTLERMSPGTIERLWDDMVMKHVVDGHDTYDRTSSGGFNAKELETFIGIACAEGWNPPSVRMDGPKFG